MVKGINRRVIVVNTPDPKLFEQAIFLLKEDAFGTEGVSPEQVIRQARQAADSYLRGHAVRGRAPRRMGPALWGAVGACAASLCWVAGLLLF